MCALALRLLPAADGGTRAIVRDGALFCLAGLEADGRAVPLFKPAEADRLILFAEHAAAGTPAAIAHPKAVPMLATLCLALVALLDDPINKRLFQ